MSPAAIRRHNKNKACRGGIAATHENPDANETWALADYDKLFEVDYARAAGKRQRAKSSPDIFVSAASSLVPSRCSSKTGKATKKSRVQSGGKEAKKKMS